MDCGTENPASVREAGEEPGQSQEMDRPPLPFICSAISGRRTLSAAVALVLLAALSTACKRQDTLQPVESIAVGEATLGDLLGGPTRVWLSDWRRPIALNPDSGMAHAADIALAPGTRVLGEVGRRLVLFAGDVVLALNPDSVARDTLLRGVEAALLVPEAGILLQSIRRGEIVVSPLPDMKPAWGWPDIGATTTALALSPEGDRIYQAVDSGDGDQPARLLIRDRLTGRIVGGIDLDVPFRALTSTTAGDLIGVAWDGERSNASVERLGWGGGGLHKTWSAYLPAPASVEALAFAISTDGRRVAVGGGNEEAGLTLLDGETGFIIADFDTATRSAFFDERGRLYAITDAAVLRF